MALCRPRRWLINEKTHPRPQEKDCQKGKGEDQEWATSEFIDGEESRKGENPIENACAHGGEERRTEGVAAVDEDLGGILKSSASNTSPFEGDPSGQPIISSEHTIIPKAVQTCHCITSAPRIGAGAHSAAYTGTVADLAPIPKPRTKRAAKRLGQDCTTPSQMEVTAATKQEMKMVPRRPKYRLSGSVNQQPRMAQARYGAPTTRPVRLSDLVVPSLSASRPRIYH
ncbi:MAG: hypothetical protein Q9194_004764 [Teloschistes cf. exilis]